MNYREIQRMMDGENVQLLKVQNGKVTDMRIEEVLSVIYNEMYDADDLDTVYTEIVRDFINPHCPTLIVSRTNENPQSCFAILFLTMLHLEFRVVPIDSPNWPMGGFDSMPEARVAISITYMHEDGEVETAYTPGKTVNHAAVGAIIQLAREKAETANNQPELGLMN